VREAGRGEWPTWAVRAVLAGKEEMSLGWAASAGPGWPAGLGRWFKFSF
jgi:hypothetical protein